MVFAAGSSAHAGGFAVREQSTTHQGASFAGNAAGSVISSQFWNPATLGLAGHGLTTESSYSVLYTVNEMTAVSGTFVGPAFAAAGIAQSTDSGGWALVPSSYASYRLSPDLVLGVGLNAPFGLGSEPEDVAWAGSPLGRSSKLTTYNLNPNLSYRLAPGLYFGAGLQLEYAKLRFKFAAGTPFANNAVLDITDTLGVGFTAGLLWQAGPGTTWGLGFRSSVKHDFEGDAFVVGAPGFTAGAAEATFETPETVTLSLRQALSPRMRALASIEWSNWSRLDNIPVVCATSVPAFGCASGAVLGNLDTHWDDGWYYSVGLEYDYQPGLTLRTGIAYEVSPAQNATGRLVQIPDSNRIWLSGGLSYQVSHNMTLDFAYTHVFVEDAQIERDALTLPLSLVADREASVDIISFGYKYKWGRARTAQVRGAG